MTNIILLKDIFELLSYIAVVGGIPLALYNYIRTKKKEQLDRDYGTYNALDEKYIEFQKLCLQYPYLDVFDVQDVNPVKLNEQQKKEELIAFTMLFSIFERAFLMYYDASDIIKKKQWSGWNEYIREYCSRDNFKSAWRISRTTFDTDYQNFMERTIQASNKEKV